ncbi:MAG: NusG domain II-containing protein [Christensenellales bacterium]|jgi:hypothetical protein
MKKRDILLIAGILVVAAALFFGVKYFVIDAEKAVTGYVSITVNGREWIRLPLDQPTSYTVHQSNGNENTITIDEGGDVYVSHSNCDNQDCVEQGHITPENVGTRVLMNQIICLPNGVVVTVVYDNK